MVKDKNTLWDPKWKMLSFGKDKLGQGGQGVVRKVENLASKEIGALKELINFTNVERRKRMHIEATSLAALEHPNICKLLDYDTTSDGRLYIVTEFIDGVTLEEKISGGSVSIYEMQELAKKLLSALNHAHSISVFHRDIKPENIILRGRSCADPVLIDFGISFNDEENLFSSATFHGQQLGNRFLHLPELQRGAREPRSDLTQLCGVLLYTLTGIIPVTLIDGSGKYPHQVTEVRQSLDDSIENNIVKQKLLRIFDKAFHVKLDDRWQTAEELMEALEKVTMSEVNENEIVSLELVRQSLASDPDQKKHTITNSFYNQFMKHTRNLINSIIAEMRITTASLKQGGARRDLRNGTFGSNFGITLPKYEIYLRLNGTVVGDEVTILIQDDETILCRFNTQAPNWNQYRESLKAELVKRLNQNING